MARTKQTARQSHQTDAEQIYKTDGATVLPPPAAPPPPPPPPLPPPLPPTAAAPPPVSNTSLHTSNEAINNHMLLNVRDNLKKHFRPKQTCRLDKTAFIDKDCLDVVSILKHLKETKFSEGVNLDLSYVGQFTDIFFLILKLNEKELQLNYLESIDLSGCCNITDEGIRWLSETESSVMTTMKLKGCKQLTQRCIYRLADKKIKLEKVNLTATSCAFFPDRLNISYMMDMTIAQCPLVSPTKYSYNCCQSYSAFSGTYANQDFVPYPHHKLLVLHSDQQDVKGIFTGKSLDRGISIQRGWRHTEDTSEFYNVFEVLTGNALENLVLSNGCIIILPFTSNDDKTASTLASLITTVLGQYPENVFVLAELSGRASSPAMKNRVIDILQHWTAYVSDSVIYKGGSDNKVLTEWNFADQMQLVFSQTLLDNLKTLISQPDIISDAGLTYDPEHSYLETASKILEKHFPWHLAKFMEEPIQSLEAMTKQFCSVLPPICPLSTVVEDVKGTQTSLIGCDEIDSAMKILHDRGLCVYFPDVGGKPSFPDISDIPTITNLTGKAPHSVYIQGLGSDVPCWRKDDFSCLNDKIMGHENLLINVLRKMGLIYRFACCLPEYTDNVLYVLTSDLPDNPYIPLDKVWPDELMAGEEQKDCYMTFPAMPSSLLHCFIRKLQEMSKILLMWRTGTVVRQGPVMILVKQIQNHACHDLPGLVISGRVLQSNLGNTLTLTFNNIRTILEAILMKRKIYAVKSVCCEACNPTKSTRLALSNDCCQVREIDVRISTEPVTCTKTSTGIVTTKEALIPQSLPQEDYIPNHQYKLMMTQGFTKKLSVTPRCIMCNNCCAQGVYCPENLKPVVSNRLCSCKYKASLCVYCGVCDQCLYTITKAHVTVQPSFRPTEESPESQAQRIGNLVTFHTEQQYYLPDYLHPQYNNHLSIEVSTMINFTIELQHFSTKGAEFTVTYMTSTGEITMEKDEDIIANSNKHSCNINDWLDFQIVLHEDNPFKKKMQIHKNGDFVFEFDLTALGRTSVRIKASRSASLAVYTPNLIKKEKIDTKNKENFHDGRILKCCGAFPTVLESRMLVMWPALETGLLNNNNGDLVFTGTAGVMLPEDLRWDDVMCPTPRMSLKPVLFHPLCVANVHNGLELDYNTTWRQQSFLMHLLNAEGHALQVSDETMGLLIWAWQCLLVHYPLLDLPPVYDKLFPELPSLTGVEDHKAKLLGHGVHDIMLLYVMNKLSSFGENFGRDKVLRITTTKVGRLQPYNNSGASELRNLVKDNLARFGLGIMVRKKQPNYVCLSHASCRSPSGNSGNLTEIPKLVFSANPLLLTCLKLPGNRLTTIPAETFRNLPHLIKLDLSNNFIEALSDSIGHCKELLFLNVEANNLEDLPSSLVNCTQLYQIHISNNCFQVLPPVLVQMTGIRRLLACNLMLTELPEDFGNMTGLTFLLLKGNCITRLPKSFVKLQKLKTLSITGVRWIQNKVNYFLSKSHFVRFLRERDIDKWVGAQPEKLSMDDLFELFDLNNSSTLDTMEISKFNAFLFKLFPRFGSSSQELPDDNSPSWFPEELFALRNLRVLDLSYQAIVHVPPEIKKMENLNTLTLSHNPYLLSIAGEASQCPLSKLSLEECPLLKTPPKEIRDRGFKTTYAYLNRLMTGSVDCKRTKLMLVGLGGAGKTSLVRTLMSSDEESHLTGADAITDGIDICTWDVDHGGHQISYSVWDFAGQTVYYNTHQFFLSDRAVYLLLWNTRLGHEHAGLKFWLNSISVHAPKAPIFVVGTHSDQMTKMDLPVDDMQLKYHQINSFHFVSSKTGDGISNLRETLFETTLQQDYMGEKIPRVWLQFESLIYQGRKKNTHVMTYEQVEKIAEETGITDPSEVTQAIQFLHDLGSVQYFPTEYLRGHVVINPQWIVDVMACVVSVKQEVIQDGRLMHSSIETVWSEYHKMADWLLKLTEEFDLTFQLEGENCNIVPCLLPEKRPNFEWPDISKDEDVFEMKMVYKFDYLPAGLFNRGQVRLHGYSEDSLIWKRGSYIEKNGQLALIQQEEDSELSVKVQGPNPNNILLFIHEVFEGLINESFHGVTYDYEIPCPDCTKQRHKDPHMFKASSIRRALELKAPFLQCQKRFHTVPLLTLQTILAPDTNSDYEVHLDQDVNNLIQMQKEMATDIFISYCSGDAPKERSNIIHPADICADLEKEGFSCYFPEGATLNSREEMAQHLVHSSVFLALISNNYAANEVCCDMYKYAVSTMKLPTICVALGENFDWKKSPSLGVITSDVVFVNMINSKKVVYKSKLNELLSTLQKNEQISQVKPESAGSCFISYSWANSRLAVQSGTKELPGALGFGDPRQMKPFLEQNGIKCWIDVDQVNVNDQLLNRIAQGLSEARVVVACVSDQYAQSKICCKEMRFAVQLELPIVVAIVGTGTEWKRSEVGFNSMSYPVVDFQRPNPNANQDLLSLVKSVMLPEHAEQTEKRKKKDSEKANTTFKEMYELAQRKFLRQISNFALGQDMPNYPRLFVVDIAESDTQDTKKVLPNEDNFKSRNYCLYTLCECEQGWHSVGKPLSLGKDFIGLEIEDYASYLAHVTLVMRHSPDFILNLFSDVDGQQYLKYIQELTVKSTHTFESSYQQMRQKVYDLDTQLEKGQLKRCRLPSGKAIWLCEEHIAKLKVTVLNENLTETKQKSTNQVWVEAMIEALKFPLDMPFTFKPTVLVKRTFNTSADDMAEVERQTQMTLSQKASQLDQTALKQAIQEVQKEEEHIKHSTDVLPGKEDGDVIQASHGTKESPRRKKKSSRKSKRKDTEDVQDSSHKEENVSESSKTIHKFPSEEDVSTLQVPQEDQGSPRKEKEDKPKREKRKSRKSIDDEDVVFQETSVVDHSNKRTEKLADVHGTSPTLMGRAKLAPIPSAENSSTTQPNTEQDKCNSPDTSKTAHEDSPTVSKPQTKADDSRTVSAPVLSTQERKEAKNTSSSDHVENQGKRTSKTCVII